MRKYEKNYTISEKEALAVVATCKAFDVYLHNQPFTLITDHSALRQIFDNKNTSPRLVRWALALQHLNMTIKYRQGNNNGNADALSRMPQVNSVIRALPQLSVVAQAQKQDPWMNTMITWLTEHRFEKDTDAVIRRRIQLQANNFSCKNNVLYYTPKGQIKHLVIPMKYRQDLIHEFHNSPFGGHFGAQRTLSRISKFYWWQGMAQQISTYCTNCIACQLRKHGPQTSKQHLTPWPATSLPMTRVAVDTFGPIKQSKHGNTVVLVMIDFLTRFAWTVPLPNQQAATLARAMTNIFLQTGFPAELVSDAGTNFVSNIVTEMCKLLEIAKYTVQPLDQKANGLVERFMATLANSLTQYTSTSQDNWCEYVPFVTFAYNTADQQSVGDSPFFLMYHWDPKIPIDNLLAHKVSTYNENVKPHDLTAMNFQLAWQNARDNLKQQQIRQKQHYDKTAITSRIAPGSQVVIKRNTTKQGLSNKLTYQFDGPYCCVCIEGKHLFLTPLDKPNSTPFSWHIYHAKLFHTEEEQINPTLTAEQHEPQQRRTKGYYPIDHPAKHWHYLRSKVTRANIH